jgi:ACS family allantoate permease-like MFS transporter
MVGISVLIWLPDSPVHARMLTRQEKIAALERVRDGQGGTENHHLKKEQVWEAVTDIRSWLIVLIVLTSTHSSTSDGAICSHMFSKHPEWRC